MYKLCMYNSCFTSVPSLTLTGTFHLISEDTRCRRHTEVDSWIIKVYMSSVLCIRSPVAESVRQVARLL